MLIWKLKFIISRWYITTSVYLFIKRKLICCKDLRSRHTYSESVMDTDSIAIDEDDEDEEDSELIEDELDEVEKEMDEEENE